MKMIGNRHPFRPDKKLLVGGCLMVACALGAIGCSAPVTMKVTRLSPDMFPPRPPQAVLDEWQIPPNQPYVEIAKLIATSTGPDEADRVREKVVERARQLGADGIIINKTDVLEDIGPTRSAVTGSVQDVQEGQPELTVGPWFEQESPFFDERLTYYLHATAIKYRTNSP